MPDFDKNIMPAGGNHNAFGRAYLFTNENIAEYVKKFDLQGKRILSVAAGGDHAFESLLAGASFVDTFDINYAQKPIVELKNHMIKSLPYEDFMDFFFDKTHFFDQKIIEPIWNKFSYELQLYLDWYYCMGPSAARFMFVYGQSNATSYNKENISYIADKNKYNALAQRLPKQIRFTHANAYEISKKIDIRYDIILLSNILDYLDIPRIKPFDTLVHCYNRLLKPLAENNLTTQNGCIAFDYIWSSNMPGIYICAEQWDKFMHKFNHKKKDYRQSVHKLDIASPFNPDIMDSVLYMTQNQKIK